MKEKKTAGQTAMMVCNVNIKFKSGFPVRISFNFWKEKQRRIHKNAGGEGAWDGTEFLCQKVLSFSSRILWKCLHHYVFCHVSFRMARYENPAVNICSSVPCINFSIRVLKSLSVHIR